MVLGGKHETGVTTKVQSGGTVKVVDNAGTLEVVLPDDKGGVDSIRLEDTLGVQVDLIGTGGTPTTGATFAVPVADFEAKEGDELQYFYMKEITGSKYTIDATVFGNKCHVTYRTLSYDLDTEAVYSDIWWEFPSVSSDGNLDLSLTAGEALTSTLTFTATVPKGATELGYKYEQLRV